MYSVCGRGEAAGGHESSLQCVEALPVIECDGEVDVMSRPRGVEAEHMGHQYVACGCADEKIIAAELSRYRPNRGQDLEKYWIEGFIESYRVHAQ